MLRFDPFTEVDDLAQRLLAAGRQPGSARSPRFMPMDLYQVDDHYVLAADLPGADPGSIGVSVENGVLTLTGQRSTPSDSGVRWLTIPVAERAKPRQIVVEQGAEEPPCEQLAVESATTDG